MHKIRKNIVQHVPVEAGSSCGWNKLAASNEDIFCIERFGESGPAAKVAEALGFTAAELRKVIER